MRFDFKLCVDITYNKLSAHQPLAAMKQLLLCLMALAIIPNAIFSQAFVNEQHPLQRLVYSAEISTDHVPFEESGLNTDMPTIDDLVDRLSKRLEQLGYPGMAFSMVTPERVLWSGGMGYADLEARRKVDPQTQFRLGSLTKGVIALGILKLVEEGKFDLESKLKDLAPEVPFENRFSQW